MATPEQLRQQTLALAALAQSIYLADRIAHTGDADPQALEASLHSLFSFSAGDAEQAYKGVGNLEIGLRCLIDMVAGSPSPNTRQLIRYSLGVLHVHKLLKRDNDTAGVIRSRLEHAHKGLEFNNADISGLSQSIAAIYQDTISHFRFRIQISGSMQQLQNPNNAARIRALLMAAIRAVYLWRQAGGSRLSLLFGRNKLLIEARRILDREIPR